MATRAQGGEEEGGGPAQRGAGPRQLPPELRLALAEVGREGRKGAQQSAGKKGGVKEKQRKKY